MIVANGIGPRSDLRETFGHYRGRIAILFVLCVGIYFLVAFGEQAWRARQLQAEVAEQQAAIAAIDRENVELREQLETYGTDAYLDYVQSRARRDLNLANADETVLLLRWGARPDEAAAEPTAAAPAERKSNWRRWIDAFAGS